jgi:cystathionine beta-lyase
MSERDPADHPATRVAHLGSDPARQHGAVNPPVYHASTIIFESVAELEAAMSDRFADFRYGRLGTPTSRALETAMAELEGGTRAMLVPSGLAAIGIVLMASLKAGDHLLMTDSAYGPARHFASRVLTRFGVETTFYDPLAGPGIASLMRPNTRVVYLESPGSLTFEVQDVPALAAAAHAHGARVIMDNTWATPLFFRPLEHGVDVVVHAATKYIAGHSDTMLGIIVTNAEAEADIRHFWADLGASAGPDDIYFGLRGLRTLAARMQQHYASALEVASWLTGRPEVREVIYPALPGSRGHDLWRRLYNGASGLFGVVLQPCPKPAVDAMLDGMRLFRMGWSWGGFESLIVPIEPGRIRATASWQAGGPCLRLHVGLEDPADLVADLQSGLHRLAKTAVNAGHDKDVSIK